MPYNHQYTEPELVVDILVVDDNPHNVLTLEAMLEGEGQNIVRASSGTEALRHLLERDFALALLDIRMPGLDGFETAQIIRGRERSRLMPIIFLTAFSKDEDEIAEAYKLGAVDFLLKPFVPLVLRSKVQVFVDLHRKTREIRVQSERLRDLDQREHDRQLTVAAQHWEGQRLREEMERERTVSATLMNTVADRRLAEAALKVSHARLSLLSDIANRLLMNERPVDALRDIYIAVSSHLQLEVFASYLVEPDGETLMRHTVSGVDDVHVEIFSQEGSPITRMVAHSRLPLVLDNIQRSTNEALSNGRTLGLEAIVTFPLLAHGRLLGTLAFGTRRRPVIDLGDIEMLQILCDQVAIALERTRLIDELSLRNEALAHADRRKDEFLAMLAHELRNPMAPIVNAVQLLRTPDVAAAVTQRALEVLDRQAGHMVRLVDDLLDLARITTGKIELRRDLVLLSSIVDHAIQTNAPWMEERGHRLEVSLPDLAITVFADPTRLSQVLANLLNNAAKYSPAGSTIELSAIREGNEVILCVRDHGMGIQSEMLEEIFGLFVQSDRTIERTRGGIGIGLTLVKDIVEMHGGSVRAESAGTDLGSAFSVRLPLADQTPELTSRSANGSGNAPVSRSTVVGEALTVRRVVVVEDNVDIRETMADLLHGWGHIVNTASDGPSGVEAILEFLPDIAFIDIGLPGLDGYQVASALRQRAPNLPTRLVALTGYGSPEDRARALAEGFDEHTVKPITPDLLFRLLAESSGKRERA